LLAHVAAIAGITCGHGRRDLNHEIVRAGFAWWYRQYARGDGDLEGLEREARDARRGLWADSAPMPPWEWRKERRAKPRSPKRSERRSERRSGRSRVVRAGAG
jgi:endonuclease YncB( thermonuclease family)